MTPAFRLIVHPRMEGRLDMAIDEALAEAVGRGESPPVVRLYGFSPATSRWAGSRRSRAATRRALLRADGVTLVRRPTGGHAVLHDNELTYSVAAFQGRAAGTLPRGRARKGRCTSSSRACCSAGLANLGIAGTINARSSGDIAQPRLLRLRGRIRDRRRGRAASSSGARR